MKIIPVKNIGTTEEPILAPAQPLPAGWTAMVCDGENYTIYEAGDELPNNEESQQ